MELYSIASGSSGNCIYVSDGNVRLLVDAGISKIRIEEGLNKIGVSCQELDGILVTHEHSDHIKGLGVLTRKYHLPVYTTAGTANAIIRGGGLGKLDTDLFRIVKADEKFLIEDMQIDPIGISHDAAEPVAYRFESGENAAAVITDLGYYDEYIVERLQNLDMLLMESNHDIRMLEVGRYPYPLKRRILGEYGHLSNEACGRLLCRIISDRLRYVLLGHLSHENNLPELASETVKLELDLGDVPFTRSSLPIMVAKREEPTPPVKV